MSTTTHTLPKTKASFAKFLGALSGNKRFNPGSITACPLAAFLGTRTKRYVCMGSATYEVNGKWHITPDWATEFQLNAMHTPGRHIGGFLTVAKLRKILEAV